MYVEIPRNLTGHQNIHKEIVSEFQGARGMSGSKNEWCDMIIKCSSNFHQT